MLPTAESLTELCDLGPGKTFQKRRVSSPASATPGSQQQAFSSTDRLQTAELCNAKHQSAMKDQSAMNASIKPVKQSIWDEICMQTVATPISPRLPAQSWGPSPQHQLLSQESPCLATLRGVAR